MPCSTVLWYNSYAKAWTQALPIGNGTLGAMIFGNPKKEVLSINHDELWSGKPKNTIVDGAPESYIRARDLALKGKFHEAQEELETKFQGVSSETYMPLGDLHIEYDLKGFVSNYKRSLDIEKSLSTVEFTCNKVDFKREFFASYPSKMLAAKLTCSSGTFSFKTYMTSKIRAEFKAEGNIIRMDGECPSEQYKDPPETPVYHEAPEDRGILFRGGLKVITDGKVSNYRDRIKVADATYAEIYFTAATSFNGWNTHPHINGKEYVAPVEEFLAKSFNYDEEFKKHTADYSELFGRVKLSLPCDKKDLPTDKRLLRFKKTKDDNDLIVLVYNFGRYLAISSSRQGSQPSNLQGIWNVSTTPPWRANYTVNINTEMNYWPVLMCRMPEINEPLIRMIKELSESGSVTAEKQYSAKGWTSHHNVDIWRLSTPVEGSAQWAFWHGSSGWFCEHLFDHYEYTNDVDFLRETAYPIMKSAAEFYLSIMTEENGEMFLCPGTSPENGFIYEGKACNVAKHATMSTSIAKELFGNCIKACNILGIDSDFAAGGCKLGRAVNGDDVCRMKSIKV